MIVSLEMAMSPNGLIARENGQEDWLSSENWNDFLARARQAGNIVMGRETYELVTKLYEDYNFDNVECRHKVIVSKNKNFEAKTGYTVVNSPEDAIDYVERSGCKELLLIGGGKLNKSFIESNLADKISVTFEPYIIGRGRDFLAGGEYEVKLTTEKVEELSKGRVKITYKVNK